VSDRIVYGNHSVRLTYMVFDLLELDGDSTMRLPLRERRQLLDALNLHGPKWQTSTTFDDGEALLAVAIEHGLEGVVGKRTAGRQRPDERSWIKSKNRA
jgi:bifunctional non-homologous end joining protein LigD